MIYILNIAFHRYIFQCLNRILNSQITETNDKFKNRRLTDVFMDFSKTKIPCLPPSFPLHGHTGPPRPSWATPAASGVEWRESEQIPPPRFVRLIHSQPQSHDPAGAPPQYGTLRTNQNRAESTSGSCSVDRARSTGHWWGLGFSAPKPSNLCGISGVLMGKARFSFYLGTALSSWAAEEWVLDLSDAISAVLSVLSSIVFFFTTRKLRAFLVVCLIPCSCQASTLSSGLAFPVELLQMHAARSYPFSMLILFFPLWFFFKEVFFSSKFPLSRLETVLTISQANFSLSPSMPLEQ